MNCLLNELVKNPAVESLLRKESSLGNLSLTEEALLYAALYRQSRQSLLIVKNNVYTAQKLIERLTPLVDVEVLPFIVEESLRVEAIAASPESKAVQLETMNAMLEGKAKIVVAHTGALMRFMPSPELFKAVSMELKVDDEISMDTLKMKLFMAGYEHVSRVDQPLCFASRGGIVDVYSMNEDYPIRIEFFDTVIESIRCFDPATQRTIEKRDHVKIIPATDLLFTDEDISTIIEKGNVLKKKAQRQAEAAIQRQFDIFIENDFDALSNHQRENHLYRYYALLDQHSSLLDYAQDACIILSTDEEIHEVEKKVNEETIDYIQELNATGQGLPVYTQFNSVDKLTAGRDCIHVNLFVNMEQPIVSGFLQLPRPELSLDKCLDMAVKESKKKSVLFCLDHSEIGIVKKYFNDHEIRYQMIDENDKIPEGISLCVKKLAEGFELTEEKIVVYSSKEIFHEQKKLGRYTNKFKQGEVLDDYLQLEKGDYVVHNQHGVGMYNGIVTKEIEGHHKDFLQVIYKDNDVLFIPLEQFRLIRKFVSKEGASPKLNKLGSSEWEKTKKRISQNVAELAQRLVALYSLRSEDIGFAFSKDTPYQLQFEDDFDYDLTPDQKKAVDEIKQDMESAKPMDRLLCGDVGFGKTEVAIRAAFKAVVDNKQVAYLCPTTILSQQHFKTFKKRFRNYPVRIEVLNRFVPPQEQKKILQDLKDGNVDILIGTHRLLSKDVVFKDLGFLIIDEEQRFGVQHKEKIKELRTGIDVLSLSATPIPRTLQMSLIGVRSLSQLDTPPMNRMPVQTYVVEKNFNLIKEIIQREIARDGQVFYLYNNVKNIYATATKLRNELDMEIGIAHGQMDREEIEDVMMRFTNNEYQVLVCTTIIETGIDIPNANTIIIEDADKFGLSQLYQIKGRVGRSDRLAYAYLLYSPQKQLSEIATKRLKSIKEFTQLGSGYKIAMRDLTIRGAGDMLGPQQAGFIDTIGIDMYIEMLHDAINEQKGIKKAVPKEIKRANVNVDAYIPSTFTDQDYEKITLYQQIDKVETKEELLAMMDMIEDNYGSLPKSVQLLFEKKRLDILINEANVENFKENAKDAELTFTEQWSKHADGVKLFEQITALSRDIVLRYTQNKIKIRFPKNKNWLKQVIEVLEMSGTVVRE
ncbi:transcription-repair coupling factor [Dielma fastidiosa]|uniref:transcription-repair coupling factor n=1 Tax=Dielma fastidiosa TaxID=1034346 RepID=UPI000E502019|nr:transcription-repair coupling factor [Dielma fastidiosa]RHM98633.1 transcription-repair coupling factor [Dielma fastidiosa]